MRRVIKLLLVTLVVALGASAVAAASAHDQRRSARAAAVCADFSDQLAAQQAADTGDGDGDGIYCESNPCPCSSQWYAQHGGGPPPSTSAPPPASPTPVPRPGPSGLALGRSVTLAPVRKRTGCRVRGPLPDAGCTPGARFSKVTAAQVCRPGYAERVRDASAATKATVYRAYGIRKHFNGATGEVDHLVSLELGGSNAIANLFPEASSPRPGSHEKDKLENELHTEVCAHTITLRHAQLLIARDWVSAYRARFTDQAGRGERAGT